MLPNLDVLYCGIEQNAAMHDHHTIHIHYSEILHEGENWWFNHDHKSLKI